MMLEEMILQYKKGKLSTAEVQEQLRLLINQPRKIPLSEGQKGLWALHKITPGLNAYNVPLCFRIFGELDIEKFKKACYFLKEQYPILNSVIEEENGEPYQTVRPGQPLAFRQENIATLENEAIIPYVRTKMEEPFSLENGPLMRVLLFSRSENEWIVLITVHHIIFDGKSSLLLMEALLEAYRDLLCGKKLVPAPSGASYADFVEWERRMLASDEGVTHLSYWKQQLSGTLPVFELLADHPRSSARSFQGRVSTIKLSIELAEAVKSFAASRNMSPAIFFLGVFNVLLYRYTGQDDLIVGMPVLVRPEESFDSMVGYFINMVPIRSRGTVAQPFIQFIQELQLTVVDALDHAVYPFPALVRELNLPRVSVNSPLFETAFFYQNFFQPMGLKTLREEHQSMFSVEFAEGIHQEGEYEFALEVFEQEDGFALNWKYNPDLFEPATVARMMGHYAKLAAEVIDAPALRLADYCFMTREEQERILYDWNNTRAEFPGGCIHEMIELQAQKTPEAVAVIYGKQSLTYRELSKKVNRLATRLRSKGVQPDSVVGIMVERSLEMLIGILGILKAGGAYLPVDPNYPEARIQYLLEDSGSKLLLTQRHFIDKIKLNTEIIDLEAKENYPQGKAKLAGVNRPGDLAYVIYTSGSTGKPKGVMIEHRAAVNRLHWMQKEYHLEPGDTILQKTPYTFDVSVWELFWWGFAGAKVCFLEPGGEKDPAAIVEAIAAYRITTMHFVPSMLSAFLEYLEPRTDVIDLSSLRLVFASGEALNLNQREKFNRLLHQSYGAKLHNLYGPTEATVDVSYFNCSASDEIEVLPIGKPIDNIQLYIVDQQGRLQPAGIPGELYIAGIGLARGYLNRPELTAEKFVPNPFAMGYVPHSSCSEGTSISDYAAHAPRLQQQPLDDSPFTFHPSRMYRTGDLARFLPDGNIEYLGRMDNQVKVRGNRIELGEIESQLRQHEQVSEALVMAEKDQSGNQYLCAYVTGARELTVAVLRSYLAQKLPEYMIPSYFVQLDKFPLSPNGKVDRKALAGLGKKPESGSHIHSSSLYIAPCNKLETQLAGIWQEVLGVGRVGIDDNFFELGGDSIKAIQVSSRLYKIGLSAEFKEIFHHPRISELVNYVKVAARSINQVSIEGETPLTPIQRWFFREHHTARQHFNHAVMVYRHEGFDEETIRVIFNQILTHHDALRMVYRMDGADVIQVNRGLGPELYDFTVTDLRLETDYAAMISQTADKIHRSMDLTRGPLVKLGLFKTREGDHLLLIIHHLVVDGISWRIILEDFALAYRQVLNHQAVELPEKTDSYRSWAQKLHEYSTGKELQREIKYWREMASTAFEALPKDRPRVEDGVTNSGILEFSLDKAETGQLLKQVNHAYHTEIMDILLTALGLTVKEWTGANKVLISLEGHGREEIIPEINITRTVGWFTSIYPALLDMTRSDDLSYLIKHVKETLRRIPHKGIGYGIIQELTGPNPKDAPVFQLKPEICFNYLGQFRDNETTDIFQASPISTGTAVSPSTERSYTLDINCMVSAGRFTLIINYSREAYPAETIQQLLDHYAEYLRAIINHCCGRESSVFTPADFGDRELPLAEFEEMLQRNQFDPALIEKIYPLAPMQAGMLFHALFNPGGHTYFEQISFVLKGALAAGDLEKSLQILAQRYELFRTVFVYEKLSSFRQIVIKEKPVEFCHQDLTDLSEPEQQKYIETFKINDRERGFDLAKGPLIRLTVMQTGPDSFYFVWSFHHIIMDGWCLGIVNKELFEIYDRLNQSQSLQLDELIPYSRYIEWLRKQDEETAVEYWTRYLDSYEQQATVPKSGVAAPEKYRRAEHGFTIDCGVTEALLQIAKQHQVTLNTIFQTLWGILLQKYNNSNDVVYGAVTSGRPAEIPGIERLVGLFINTVPVRIKNDRRSFSDLLKEVQDAALVSRQYEYLALSEIQSHSELKRDLIQHILIFENYPVEEAIVEEHRRFCISAVEVFEQTNYDFNLMILPGRVIMVRFLYNNLVYDSRTIQSIEGHFREIINQIIKCNDIPVAAIEILTPAEKRRVIYEFNDTTVKYPQKKTILDLFDDQVMRTPERIAAEFNGEQLTYRELGKQSALLAIYLQKQGIRPDCLVGICVDRSLEMLVGLLGILKSGGAYVPLDPHYPAERLEYMLMDSQVALVLSQTGLTAQIAPLLGEKREVIALDGDWVRIEKEATGRPLRREVEADHLAYVIYTSGSTGKPKGVMIPHQALTNFMLSMAEKPGMDFQDTLLAVTTYCFDIAGLELYLPLIKGAKVCICSAERMKDPELLKAEIQRVKPTIMQATPVTWTMLFQIGWRNEEKLKILCGGEALPERLKQYFSETRSEAWNMFGPTETTIWSTVQRIKEEERVTIGKPIANTQVYILDRDLKVTPQGVPGELCIAGDGLARGYLNRPELTAETFIPDPFGNNADLESQGTGLKSFHTLPFKLQTSRLYRTGDLACWLQDGNLEFLGRLDHQVKIRGYRIELGEIETRLRAHPEIRECAVVVKEQGGVKQLIAYCLRNHPISGPDEEKEIPLNSQALREYLKENLPDYMIPAVFVELDAIPLTPNGKIDRKDLMRREIAPVRTKKAGVPQSQIEEKVLEIWREVLQIQDVSTEAGFFDIGGNSILAVAAVQMVNKELACDLTVTSLFKYSNIKEFSAYIAEIKGIDTVTQVADDKNTGVKDLHPDEKFYSTKQGQTTYPDYYEESLAIIGISCQVPGAKDHFEFWQNLRQGKESVRFFTEEELNSMNLPDEIRKNPQYIPVQATIEGKEWFDPGFFKISPRDAAYMDPQFRLLLVHSWKAMEDAGYVPQQIPETGVFMSASNNFYQALISGLRLQDLNIMKNSDEYVSLMLGQGGTIPTMISYKLGLKGPSYFVHSNCSSSLIGLYSAYQCLRAGEARYALVGGATIFPAANAGYVHEDGLNFSSDGHCRTFDAAADGMIGGEGVAVIVLKKAPDAIRDRDHIYALIRGIGVNNDGAEKAGFYAPGVKGQAAVIRKVLEATKIHPETISYVEAHGTGTKLGDPIELMALSDVYQKYTARKQFCGIGSVKTNIGHLDTAAGLAGCVKVALSLCHMEIPPSINYRRPNPDIEFESSPFYVADRLQKQEMRSVPYRAALSSFGIGGTNTHAILEEYIDHGEPKPVSSGSDHGNARYIIPLSARNHDRLKAYARKLLEFLRVQEKLTSESNNHSIRKDPGRYLQPVEESLVETINRPGFGTLELNDLAYTLQVGREPMECRVVFAVGAMVELKQKLAEFIDGKDNVKGCFKGEVKQTGDLIRLLEKDEDSGEFINKWVSKRKFVKLAELWVKGYSLDWEALYLEPKPLRISLPTYPFAEEYIAPPAATRDGAFAASPGTIAGYNSPRLPSEDGGNGVLFGTGISVQFVTVTGKEKDEDYTEIERKVADVWGRELGLREINIHDNFYDMGGNSLIAVKLEVEMGKNGLTIEAPDIENLPSVAQISEFLSRKAINSETSTKTLDNIEPFNGLYYRNCFYNALFPVIKHFNKDFLPVLANDVAVITCRPVPEDKLLTVNYKSNDLLEQLLKRQGIYVSVKRSSNNIIKDLIASIAGNRPVIITLDCYYAPLREDLYQKEHWMHYWLVYGYDDTQQIFRIIEHLHRGSLTYGRHEVKYRELEDAFAGGREYFHEDSNEPSFYAFHIEETTGPAEVNIDEFRNAMAINMIKNKQEVLEGLQWIKVFEEGFKTAISNGEITKSIHQVTGMLNEIINARKADMYKLNLLFSEEETIAGLLGKVIKSWDFIRIKLARCIYSSTFDTEPLQAVLEKLAVIYGYEMEYYSSLIKFLEEREGIKR